MELVQGGPTKAEIAVTALSKFNLTSSDVFADIGCGTGNISIMAARQVKEVFAIDKRKEAITAARNNIKNARIENVNFIHGEAPAVLNELPALDCAFVGGTLNIEKILHALNEKVKGRIVANAVRIQTVSTIIETMRHMGIFYEAIHLQVSKSYLLAGEIAFKPINPVYIIVGDTQRNENKGVD